MPFKINKTKLILTFFVLPVLTVFLIAATCAGCRYNNTDYAPIKTPVEASITIAVDESTAEDQEEAKKQYKKLLPEPVVQNMPYYYIAVLNNVENSNEAASELDIKLSHLIEIVNAADSSNIKLTLMFCPRWAEMFYENSSKLALLDDWKQNGHEISCYHRSIYSVNWDGYTDFSYDEALRIRREITDKNFANEYAGNMSDFINKLKIINRDVKSGYVKSGARDFIPVSLKDVNLNEEYTITDNILYYTLTADSSLLGAIVPPDSPGPETGLNKYILNANIGGIYRKYLSHLYLESRQGLDSAIKTSEAHDSSYVFGLAFLNESNLLKYYYSLLQYIQVLDPEGLNSKTLSQTMEDKILEETSLLSRQ